MAFGRKRRVEDDEEEEEERSIKLKGKSLEKKKRKKEELPRKPWGKRERYFVLSIVILTSVASLVLAFGARQGKLPGLPRFSSQSFGLSDTQILTKRQVSPNTAEKQEQVITQFSQTVSNLSGVYAFAAVDTFSGTTYGVNQLGKMVAVQNAYLDLKKLIKKSELKEFPAAVESAMDLASVFEKIYQGRLLTPPSRDTLFTNFLETTIFDARKIYLTGTADHEIYEVGIVYTENPYIVVIVGSGVVESEAENIFPVLNQIIFDGQRSF